MSISVRHQYHLQNYLHTTLLLLGMLALLALIGGLIAGRVGVIWSLLAGLFIFITAPRLPSRFLLRLYGARQLYVDELPSLYQMLHTLAQRAGMQSIPVMYYLPSRVMNAFSLGTGNDTAIVVSDGLLRHLNQRELYAVLAHEISHIRNHDLMVLALADVISRVTSLMSLTGYLLILIYIPANIFTGQPIPWFLLIVLMIAPNISALLQLGLSRTREYVADQGAVQLTNDPQGLMAALDKIEHYQGGWMERVFMPNRKLPDPSLLRTHPLTEERIKRLYELAQQQSDIHPHHNEILKHSLPESVKRPRRRINGLWY
ncbi:MAG TPA: zinc metalloprotease HtpX [Gammaproteobacteria bacterium]